MNLLSLFAQTSNDIYAVDMSNTASSAVALGIFIFLGAILLTAYAVISYLLSRIFKKAGVAGWKAWVPVYNTWITLELGGQKGWISLLLTLPGLLIMLSFIPGMESVSPLLSLLGSLAYLTALVFLYIAMYKIGLHFGKEDYFVLWAIFIPIVWYAWLAFDQSTWKESVVAASFKPAEKEDDHSPTPTV
jgi:hypothetical protein